MRKPKPKSSSPPFLRRSITWTLLALFAAVTSCEDASVSRDAYLPLQVGSVALEAQLAMDSATQKKGLMYRDSLGTNQGMLFISERPGQQSYWMRNTLIPLDIGFFTEDGILREVYPLFPRVEDPVRSRRDDIAYALEMNRGWFRENGVKVGDQLNLKLVDQARKVLATAR
jgi:uncharacterized membrane protein (UPF0127 family)